MREKLMEVLSKAKELQDLMNSMLCPAMANVPSVEQVMVWAKGQLELHRD